jgi:hypothetical protein
MTINQFARIIIWFSVISSVSLKAESQDRSESPNQKELLKQFEGTWTCEIGKDTLAQWDMIPWGTGFEARLKYIHKGNVIKEGKGLYGYDSNLDKIVEAGMTKGKDIGVFVMWFISDKKWVLVPFSDLNNPGKASFKMEGEFRSPVNLVEINYTDNKAVKTKSWSRLGK